MTLNSEQGGDRCCLQHSAGGSEEGYEHSQSPGGN